MNKHWYNHREDMDLDDLEDYWHMLEAAEERAAQRKAAEIMACGHSSGLLCPVCGKCVMDQCQGCTCEKEIRDYIKPYLEEALRLVDKAAEIVKPYRRRMSDVDILLYATRGELSTLLDY